ncbi:armadillo-type protein [Mycena olivaceomarginata]|nr:armadillo-type protein [Mycena olivaceomarginata]
MGLFSRFFRSASNTRDADDAAEAQVGVPKPLPLRPTSKANTRCYPKAVNNAIPDSGGVQHCTDDAPVWKLYMDLARISDKNLAKLLNSDLDSLLIFASLFSAILAAFLIEIRKSLQKDLQTSIPSSPAFQPTASSRWVNGLWFSSLMFSLMSALGASVAKSWVTQFSSAVSGSSWGDASAHCQRFRGLKRWRMKLIIQSLPILTHIAFFLFSAGLVVLLFRDDLMIGLLLLLLTATILLLYLGSSIHPAYYSDSPFRTPVSSMIRRLLFGNWRRHEANSFPAGEQAQKAQALTWLAYRDELLQGSTASILSTTVSLRSSLYALLHIVQAAPADPPSSRVLRALVEAGGALFDPDFVSPCVQEVALCLKGRIILLLNDDLPTSALFQTDIPFLAKSCSDPYLRCLFIELCLLSHQSAKSSAYNPPYDFLAILKDQTAANRNEVHAEFVKEANSARYLPMKFGTSVLLDGLVTGAVELRRQYATLFAELASDATFRHQLDTATIATEICSLIRCEDDDVRKEVINALGHLVGDDHSRRMITAGFPVIIDGLRTPNSRIFGDIARFISGIVPHGELRNIVAASDAMTLIIIVAATADTQTGQILMDVLRNLGSYDDIRTAITPAIIINSLLGIVGTSPELDLEASKSIVALAQYDDVRAAMLTTDTMEKIIAMLGHPNECERGDIVATALIQYGEFFGSNPIAIGELICVFFPAQFIPLSCCELWWRCWKIQQYLFDNVYSMVFFVLSSTVSFHIHRDRTSPTTTPDHTYASLLTTDAMQTILSMMGDTHPDIQQASLQTILALMKHSNASLSIVTPETMQIMISMLGDPRSELREGIFKVIITLAQHAKNARMSLSTPETVHKIVALLECHDADVRQCTLQTIVSLVLHDNVRKTMFTPEILQTVIAMLGDPALSVRQCALQGVFILVEHQDIRSSIPTNETHQKLMSLMEDALSDVRQGTLQAVISLVQHDDVCMSISTPQMIHKVVSMLWESDPHLLQCAIRGFVALAHNDSTRAVIATPETVKRIVAMIGDPDFNLRQDILEALVDLAQYNDLHLSLPCNPEIMQNIISMLGDPDPEIRQESLQAVSGLARHYDIGMSTSPSEMRQQIFLMLGSANCASQECALRSVVTLAQNDTFRPLILTPDTIQKILSMLKNEGWRVRRRTLKVVVALAHHNDVMTFLAASDIQKIVPLLGDPASSVRNGCQKALIALAEHEGVRGNIFTGQIMEGIVSILGYRYGHARHCALQTIARLALLSNDWTSISTPKIIHKIVSMLADPLSDIRETALESLASFGQHENLVTSISSPEMMQAILPMLYHPEANVRQCTLRLVVTLLRTQARAVLSSPEIIEQVISMLGDSWWSVRQCALHAVYGFTKQTDLCAPLFLPKTIQKIVLLLGDPEPGVRETAITHLLGFLENVGMLHGKIEDDNILRLLDHLIATHHDVSVIGIPVTSQALQKMVHKDVNVRKAYTKLIMLLPPSFTISSNDIVQLISLLNNTDLSIRQCGARIIMHFAENVDFRHNILRSNIWAITMKLLQRPETTSIALELLRTLGKFEDTRGSIINPTSGIIRELLHMLRAAAIDFSRWQVGFKGLLALGLL